MLWNFRQSIAGPKSEYTEGNGKMISELESVRGQEVHISSDATFALHITRMATLCWLVSGWLDCEGIQNQEKGSLATPMEEFHSQPLRLLLLSAMIPR